MLACSCQLVTPPFSAHSTRLCCCSSSQVCATRQAKAYTDFWGLVVVAKALLSAEYEDLNGGCPTPANSSVRPAYIYPVDNTISDPWAYFKRTLTFQVHMPMLQSWCADHVAMPVAQHCICCCPVQYAFVEAQQLLAAACRC